MSKIFFSKIAPLVIYNLNHLVAADFQANTDWECIRQDIWAKWIMSMVVFTNLNAGVLQSRVWPAHGKGFYLHTKSNLLNRKSYMSAQVLLNLLYELGEDKVRGLPSILSLFASSLLNSIKHEHSCKILFKKSKKATKLAFNVGPT